MSGGFHVQDEISVSVRNSIQSMEHFILSLLTQVILNLLTATFKNVW